MVPRPVLAPILLAALLAPACALPEATKVDGGGGGTGTTSTTGTGNTGGGVSTGTSGGGGSGTVATGAGGAGGAGAGGGAVCPVGTWPDSTPACSDGAPPSCPYATEDGSVITSAPSYTVAGSWVTDEVTGLVWETLATQAMANWAEADDYCMFLGLDGKTWHLPTLLELVSIADYGRLPTVPAELSQETALFWSSSVHPTGNHWGINVGGGVVAGWGNNAPGSLNARCVSGSLTVGLTVVGDVVCGNGTGLVWQPTAGPAADWTGSLDYCAAQGGGWRLPSVKELMTIFVPDNGDHLPAAFPVGEPSGKYWSSSPALDDMGRAWVVDFSAEQILELGARTALRTEFYRPRCVRDAP